MRLSLRIFRGGMTEPISLKNGQILTCWMDNLLNGPSSKVGTVLMPQDISSISLRYHQNLHYHDLRNEQLHIMLIQKIETFFESSLIH
ncbi:hypothetical protein MA16_Dca019597 [Dendrobium catenatum]|uniref:Uncharacterized protein n=1 Tax=Dendrobium catenatum TaxID=906689 RepID=A0A2I0X3S2_9ASPA|nr:hypothetical protein MA16_Dca019597 [Dendrobium catenatum]